MYFFFFLGWGSSIKSHKCSGCTKRGDPGQGLVQGTSPYLLILETEEGWVERERERGRERGRERDGKGNREEQRQTEKHRPTIPPVCALTGWFLYVPWAKIEPATLVYQAGALTNEATWPGQSNSYFIWNFHHFEGISLVIIQRREIQQVQLLKLHCIFMVV